MNWNIFVIEYLILVNITFALYFAMTRLVNSCFLYRSSLRVVGGGCFAMFLCAHGRQIEMGYTLPACVVLVGWWAGGY